MKRPGLPLFLQRRPYRRRRKIDAARLLPVFGAFLLLLPMLQGNYQTEDRSLLQAHVLRDQRMVFSALAMNDVVVNRGATSGMVELRVVVDVPQASAS